MAVSPLAETFDWPSRESSLSTSEQACCGSTPRSKSPEEELMSMREPMTAVDRSEFPHQIIAMVRDAFDTISQIDLPHQDLIREKHISPHGKIKGRMQDGKVYFAFTCGKQYVTLYQVVKKADLKSFSVTTNCAGIYSGPLTAETFQKIEQIYRGALELPDIQTRDDWKV